MLRWLTALSVLQGRYRKCLTPSEADSESDSESEQRSSSESHGVAHLLACSYPEVRWALVPGSQLVAGLMWALYLHRGLGGFSDSRSPLPAPVLRLAVQHMELYSDSKARRTAVEQLRHLVDVRQLAATAWVRRRGAVLARATALQAVAVEDEQ